MTRLVEADWFGPPTFYDVIQSYLVDNPRAYYMAPNRQWLFYLTRNHGLLQLVTDFTMMTHKDVIDYIHGVLEILDD